MAETTPNYNWPLPNEGEEFLDSLMREIVLLIDAQLIALADGGISGVEPVAGEQTTVTTAAVLADSKIQLTSMSSGVTGNLLAPADLIVPGVSFVIVTTNPTDAGDVVWSIVP